MASTACTADASECKSPAIGSDAMQFLGLVRLPAPVILVLGNAAIKTPKSSQTCCSNCLARVIPWSNRPEHNFAHHQMCWLPDAHQASKPPLCRPSRLAVTLVSSRLSWHSSCRHAQLHMCRGCNDSSSLTPVRLYPGVQTGSRPNMPGCR